MLDKRPLTLARLFSYDFLPLMDVNEQNNNDVLSVFPLPANIRDWFTRSHPSKGENRTRSRSEIASVNGLQACLNSSTHYPTSSEIVFKPFQHVACKNGARRGANICWPFTYLNSLLYVLFPFLLRPFYSCDFILLNDMNEQITYQSYYEIS